MKSIFDKNKIANIGIVGFGAGVGFLLLLNLVFGKFSAQAVFDLLILWIICIVLKYSMNENKDINKRVKVLALIGGTIFASFPALANFCLYGHDIKFHLNRICAVAEELKNCQFPVRMQGTVLNDYGYVTSLFYSDLFIYIPAFLLAWGLPLYLCYNCYIVLITFFTILISYLCFNKIIGNSKIAIAGCILYTLSMYRLINVFIRAAVGEYTAMMFLPLIILGAWNFIRTDEKIGFKEYFPLVLGMSGLIECHILSCEMVMEFGILFVLLNIKKLFRKNQMIAITKAILFCIGLNAYFLIPFVTSYGMNMELKTREIFAVGSSGIFGIQLFSVFEEYTTKTGIVGPVGGFPRTVGGVLMIGLIIFFVIMMKRKTENYQNEQAYVYGKQIFVYSVVALFLASRWFPWKYVHFLGESVQRILCQVQFAWRYLEFATVFLVILIMCVAKIIQNKGKTSWAKGMLVGLVAITVMSSSFLFTTAYKNGEAMYINNYSELGNDHVGWEEYVLAGTDTDKTKSITEPFASNSAVVKDYKNNKGKRSVYCKTSGESIVSFPVFNYDNYCAYSESDNKKMEIINGVNNVVSVKVPSNYEGNIVLEYNPPLIWRFGEAISVFSLILMIWCIWKNNRKKVLGES